MKSLSRVLLAAVMFGGTLAATAPALARPMHHHRHKVKVCHVVRMHHHVQKRCHWEWR